MKQQDSPPEHPRARAHGPVQNSEVYLLRQHLPPPFTSIPPPSPPSPITPAEPDYLVDCSGAVVPAVNISSLTLADQTSLAAACDEKLAAEDRVSKGVHVLATEAAALQNLATIYSGDKPTRERFARAVDVLVRTANQGGKVVVIGVGKSGHIARKLVATFNSLALHAVFLHPTEALHGDLGIIGEKDALLLITYSGKTPELRALLPHLAKELPLLLLTGHQKPEGVELLRESADRMARKGETILLPAPVHELETVSFGVAAPTTSTTAALAVGDALAIVVSHEVHGDKEGGVVGVFGRNHPGGAIGKALAESQTRSEPQDDCRDAGVSETELSLSSSPSSESESSLGSTSSDEEDGRSTPTSVTSLTESSTAVASAVDDDGEEDVTTPTITAKPPTSSTQPTILSMAVFPEQIPLFTENDDSVTGVDILRAAYASPSGWLSLDDKEIISPCRIKALPTAELSLPLPQIRSRLAISKERMVPVAAGTDVNVAKAWIRGLRAAMGPASQYGDDGVVAVFEGGETVGYLEVGKLLG